MTRRQPHAPTDACRDHHCAIHNVDEPSGIVCPECWHGWRNGWGLRASYVATEWRVVGRSAVKRLWKLKAGPVPPPVFPPDESWAAWDLADSAWGDLWRCFTALFRRARRIYACPICSHDF